MGDSNTPTHSLLSAPNSDPLPPSTPSGLTPNARSEAEAALTLNSTAQTDSAAPPLPENTTLGDVTTTDEAKLAYRRPGGVVRTSSSNYANALLEKARHESSVDSSTSTDSATITQSPTSPTAAEVMSAVPFPPPGQGVVPLHTGVGSGQTEAVKKARPRGLSLGNLGRMPSWSEQDMKHIATRELLGEVKKDDAGYGSGSARSGQSQK